MLSQKMYFKTALPEKHLNIAPSKKIHLKYTFQNCSLKKCVSKTNAKLLSERYFLLVLPSML